MLFAKWWPFCLGLNVLKPNHFDIDHIAYVPTAVTEGKQKYGVHSYPCLLCDSLRMPQSIPTP